jgi:hypothetical protein
MRARLLMIMAATAAVMGAFAAPVAVFAATPAPGFKLALTSEPTAVPMGSTRVVLTLWNEGSAAEAVPITVSASVPWATPDPASFLLPAGSHQAVVVTLAAGARGKAVVTFSTAPGTIGTVRVVRALASPIYLGVAPPTPSLLPQTGLRFDLVGMIMIGLIGLFLLAKVGRRRRSTAR